MKTDILYKIIENRLQDTRRMKETSQDFIQRVVHIYTFQLLQQGSIPHMFMEDILQDIEAEVIEIFRKKTYGFLTLEEYRRHKFRQENDI